MLTPQEKKQARETGWFIVAVIVAGVACYIIIKLTLGI